VVVVMVCSLLVDLSSTAYTTMLIRQLLLRIRTRRRMVRVLGE
jgi:hypothetical protein